MKKRVFMDNLSHKMEAGRCVDGLTSVSCVASGLFASPDSVSAEWLVSAKSFHLSATLPLLFMGIIFPFLPVAVYKPL